MHKHVIKIALPGPATNDDECQEHVLDILGDEAGQDFFAITLKYIASGDIWFLSLDPKVEDGTTYMYVTRFFDSEAAKSNYVFDAQKYFDALNAEVITDEEVTFEQFAEYAAENNEVVSQIPRSIKQA